MAGFCFCCWGCLLSSAVLVLFVFCCPRHRHGCYSCWLLLLPVDVCFGVMLVYAWEAIGVGPVLVLFFGLFIVYLCITPLASFWLLGVPHIYGIYCFLASVFWLIVFGLVRLAPSVVNKFRCLKKIYKYWQMIVLVVGCLMTVINVLVLVPPLVTKKCM